MNSAKLSIYTVYGYNTIILMKFYNKPSDCPHSWLLRLIMIMRFSPSVMFTRELYTHFTIMGINYFCRQKVVQP